MSSVREVVESPLEQGVDEEIQYSVTTTNFGTSPSSPAVVVKNNKTGDDVTSTVMPTGSPSASGDVITLPVMKSLTAGVFYRVEVKFEANGQLFEPYFFVRGAV